MKKALTFAAVFISMAIFCGCGPKVMVPPRINLTGNKIVGIIEFTTNSEGKLGSFITQKFIEAITEDQIINIVELGTMERILAEADFPELGPDAASIVGEKFNVNTLFTGELILEKPSTGVDFYGSFANMSVSQKVSAVLTVRMRNAVTGATLWSNSARAEREVSDVGFWGGTFHFDAEDPDRAYGKLAEKLVRDVTKDFRVTWKRK